MISASLRWLVAKGTRPGGLPIRLGVGAFGLLLVAVCSGATPPSGAIRETDKAGKPLVVVLNAPGCPLLISSTDSERLSAYDFNLGVVVVNAGLRPITFLAIRYCEYSGQSQVGSGFVGTAKGVIGSTSPNLGPGQSDEEELGGEHSQQAIERVEVAVDFVEFADGTTWGPDLYKNSRLLAGMRAGAREARAYLKGIFQYGGDYSLASATGAEHLPLEPPKNSDPEWERGFGLGKDTIQRRVRQAMEGTGREAAAKILNQPLDY